MISEDKLHHIIGVARKCYQIAKQYNYEEEFCQKMFVIGWNHDIGYEFLEKPTGHADLSAKIVKQMTGKYGSSIGVDAIKNHGFIPEVKTVEWEILNRADLIINREGNEVSVAERLEDIKSRYGEDSSQYKNAVLIAKEVGLINEEENLRDLDRMMDSQYVEKD